MKKDEIRSLNAKVTFCKYFYVLSNSKSRIAVTLQLEESAGYVSFSVANNDAVVRGFLNVFDVVGEDDFDIMQLIDKPCMAYFNNDFKLVSISNFLCKGNSFAVD